jgi:DNA repair exonuclease SbcCD nuclease subunit
MNVLILGDIHLGSGIAIGKPAEQGNLNSRVQDQIDLLNWCYEYCLDKHIEHIAITGDVYQDSRPHPAIIGIFMRWLKKCERSAIHVHIVMGNHDILRSGQYVFSALDLVSELDLECCTVYKEISRIEIDDYTLVFVPFRDKRMYEVKTKEEALNKLETELLSVTTEPSNKTKVCIGHLALEGSLSIGDEISDHLNELYVPSDIFEWFDYVWMGHIHHPQVIQHTKPYTAHIGSMDRSDFSKTEVDHGKIAIVLNPNINNKYMKIDLPIRNLLPININVPSEKESTEYVINELCLISKKIDFKNSIVRLEIQLNGSELNNVDRKKIELYLRNNLEIHHLCGFSESRNISAIQINPEDSFDNSMKMEDTINKWAETRDHFNDDQERDEFKTAAKEIWNKYKDKYLV